MTRRSRRDRQKLRSAAIPFALTLLGVAVLALAIVPLPGPAADRGSGLDSGIIPVISDADFEHAAASAPQRAGVSPPVGAPQGGAGRGTAAGLPEPTPRPVVRAPVPVDAEPVSRAGAIAGGSQTWIAQVAARTTEQMEVAIVPQAAPASAAARATSTTLGQRGINAYEARLPDVRRPDVILLLETSSAGASVWYCSPSQTASEVLANTLLDGIAGHVPEDTSATASAMPCESLHAGRASSAAALVRLPDSPSPEIALLLATAVERYLQENAVVIRSNRQALRMTWPAIGPITSHYGPDHPLGIDIGQSSGPILAATDGKVSFAGGDPCCSYGRFVVIVGPRDITTVYGHLETIAVKEGDAVRLGQTLGEVGCTGRCSGTHLHFEVIKDGVRLNPMDYLP